jgi:hypothetical protein
MSTPVHDWVLPRLNALIAEAAANGMEREVVVAVITDIVEGPGYNDVEVREEDAPAPTTETDMAREPIPTNALPVTRAAWFPGEISALPDPD